MEWYQLTVYSTYTVTVVPLMPIVFTGSTSCRLTIPYNTEYNLTVEAAAPCRPNTTASIRLKYGEVYWLIFILSVFMCGCVANCGHPELLFWRIDNSSVKDYSPGLSMVGSTVRFSCPPGLASIGSNSATCTENGRWELSSNSWPTCVQSKGMLHFLC